MLKIILIVLFILLIVLWYLNLKKEKNKDIFKKTQECLKNFDNRITEYDNLQKILFSDLPAAERKTKILSHDDIRQKFGIY